MNYYSTWNNGKIWLVVIPAISFWIISVIFFIVGLKFENPIIVFGMDTSLMIALMLSISNTIIQVIGNDQDPDDLGVVLVIVWIASYVLGIGTNIYGLLSILNIQQTILEWLISGAIGVMIEVAPEKLIVMLLKSLRIKRTSQQTQRPITQNHTTSRYSNPGYLDNLPKSSSRIMERNKEFTKR